jgi:hypothetical protein
MLLLLVIVMPVIITINNATMVVKFVAKIVALKCLIRGSSATKIIIVIMTGITITNSNSIKIEALLI